MEAARQHWRPLGELLVDKGVISPEELHDALEEQRASGRRLGEILTACGYASRPGIAEALAEQQGLVLEPERGFGTGLRDQMERRHREQRIRAVDGPAAEVVEEIGEELERSLDESLLATVAALGARDESLGLRAEVERLTTKLAEAEARIAQLEAATAGPTGDAEALDDAVARAHAHVAARRERLPLRVVARPSGAPNS